MTDWNAEKFYEENDQSEASFLVGTTPIHTDFRSYLSIVLQQILHNKLQGHGFLATVHTIDGDVSLTPEQYHELLAIQKKRDAEESQTE